MTMPDIPELLSFLNSPIAEATGWSLLHFLWQGTLVALALKASLYLLEDRDPSVRYIAGCMALASLLFLPIATDWLLLSKGPPGPIAKISVSPGGAAVSTQTGSGAGLPFGMADLAIALRPALPWIVLGWSLGVLICTVRFARGAWQARRLWRAGSPVPDRWQRQLAVLANRIGLDASVAFRQSQHVSVPTVAGWWRPVLLVPVGFLSGLPPKQVEAVLLHELAHVRRHDALVARLQAVCETLLFFHPATWWVSGQVRQAREACCDSAVVESGIDRTEYARALAALAKQARGVLPSVKRAAVGDGDLLKRVRRILMPPEPPPLRMRALSTGVALLLLVGVPLGLAAITAQQPMKGSVSSSEEKAVASASGEVVSYVLKADTSGHATLVSTSLSGRDASQSQEGPSTETEPGAARSAEPSGQQRSRIELEDLRRSVRKNLDLDQINQRLERPLTTDRLRRALRAKVRSDSLRHIADAPKSLKRAVRKEVTDSLGRTLRKKLDPETLEQTVRIRVDLEQPTHPADPPEVPASETTRLTPMPDEPALATGPEPTAQADSLFSQALSKSLSDTILVLGANTTVVETGAPESPLSIREPTS